MEEQDKSQGLVKAMDGKFGANGQSSDCAS